MAIPLCGDHILLVDPSSWGVVCLTSAVGVAYGWLVETSSCMEGLWRGSGPCVSSAVLLSPVSLFCCRQRLCQVLLLVDICQSSSWHWCWWKYEVMLGFYRQCKKVSVFFVLGVALVSALVGGAEVFGVAFVPLPWGAVVVPLVWDPGNISQLFPLGCLVSWDLDLVVLEGVLCHIVGLPCLSTWSSSYLSYLNLLGCFLQVLLRWPHLLLRLRWWGLVITVILLRWIWRL